MNSFKKKVKKSKKKHDKKRKKDRKRRRRSSSSSSDSTSSSSSNSSSDSSSDEKHRKRKHKKDRKRKKVKRIEEKIKIGESSKSKDVTKEATKPLTEENEDDFSIPIHLMDKKQKAPETKEDYEKRQSIIRRVVDEETGRSRLIKGDGEIIEEMVSKDRHRDINKAATQTDGQVYEKKSLGWAAVNKK